MFGLANIYRLLSLPFFLPRTSDLTIIAILVIVRGTIHSKGNTMFSIINFSSRPTNYTKIVGLYIYPIIGYVLKKGTKKTAPTPLTQACVKHITRERKAQTTKLF